MARRRGEPIRTLVASAARVRMEDEDARNLSPAAAAIGSAQSWQRGLIGWYNRGGEVFFGAAWVGNALSQILWNVGFGPERRPARGDDGLPIEGVDQDLLTIAEDAMGRLTGSAERQADWAKPTGELFTLVGEVWLAGYMVDADGKPVEEDDAAAYREHWEALAPTALTKKVNGDEKQVFVKRKHDATGDGEELPKSHTLVRIWRPHPFWPDEPMSPMRPLLEEGVLELLDLLTKSLRAEALSRIHQGLLVLDAHAFQDYLQKVVDENGVERPEEVKLVKALVAGLVTPKRDPGSAASTVPTVFAVDLGVGESRVPASDVATWVDLGRDTTESTLKVIELCLRRIALGLDVPAEVLTGLGGLNHWSAWLLDENSYKQHLASLVDTIAACLTSGYLWPAFRDESVAFERYRAFGVGADPSRLLRDPDLAEAADGAHDRFAISDRAYRDAKGFDEDDAPSEEELARREARRQGVTVAAESTERQSADEGPAQSPQPSRPRIVITAAARPSVRDLGRLAARVEAAHLNSTLLLADRAVNEALRRAGSRLRTRAQAHPQLKARLKGEPAERVASLLGRTQTLQLAEEDGEQGLDSLFAESTAEMEDSYARMTKAAQARYRRQLERTTGQDLTPEELERMDQDAERSRGVLVAGVLAVAAARLLDPSAYAPQEGEAPAGVSIPTSVARRASAAAGGASVAGGASRMERFEGGLTSGPTARDLATSRGLVETGIEWIYGDALRERPFEDHVDLDGMTFASLDDPELEGGPWGSYYPGDHAGCLCTVAISYDIVEEAEDAA